MPVSSRDPIDHDRTHQPRAGVAFKDNRQLIGYLLIGVSVFALMVCLLFAGEGYAGRSVAAGTVALVSTIAGWLWVYLARRRIARMARGTSADSTRRTRPTR